MNIKGSNMTDTVKSGRWIITGQFQLITSMHIGTGLDEEMDKQSDASVDKKQDNPWIQAIALDQNEKPYIPGASIKGALKALARRYYCASNLNIFGDTIDIKDRDNKRKSVTVAGQAEFLNAWYSAQQQDKPFDTVTRVAINRITGTAEDKKLFNTRRVNPGARFDYKIVVQNACETEIQYLLGLLRKAAEDPQFSLGAGANHSQGKIRCLSSCVRYFGKREMHDWFRAIQNGEQERWQTFAKPCGITPARLEQSERIAAPLNLPLALDFHTPFLVKAADTKSKSKDKDKDKDKDKNEADAKPRTNHQGQIILPASSLRGRLRAQAEKILRTLCQDIPQGHEAPAYDGDEHSDLISLLFGTAGWKGIVRASDFIHSIAEYDLEFAGLVEKQVALKKEGVSLIYVAITKIEKTRPDTQLHICVFDSERKKIIDKSENENWLDDPFSDKKSKDSFKTKLHEIDDLSKLDEKEKLDIKNTAIKLATLTRHEMIAIDRFTGGGKDGAKFNVDYVECPTLTGALDIEIQRLKNSKLKNDTHALKPALGLIGLLLRDLAEGDISFGFGVNKGYGQCRAQVVLRDWSQRLEAIENGLTVNQTLDALRTYLGEPESHSLPPFETDNTITDNPPATLKQSTGDAGLAFHNPYHFIPLGNPNIYCWPEATQKELKENKHSHDQYHTDKFSGRIVCRLTTKTPLFIGAETKPSTNGREPSEARPFKLNGKHAIPATSLRGMLSSLFESISNSNFRVLHPKKLSMRRKPNDALSAMGRIVNGNSQLIPLTFPTVKNLTNGIEFDEKWERVFLYDPDLPYLRVFFRRNQIIHTTLSAQEPCYLNYHTAQISSYDIRRETERGTDEYTVGAMSNAANPDLISESEWLKKNKTEKKAYRRGWLRTLIHEDRDLPDNVTHHVFIPEFNKANPTLTIPQDTINCFEGLADLALESMHLKAGKQLESLYRILPYTPIGRSCDSNPPLKIPEDTSCYKTRLQHNDLVFFDVDREGEIVEISFSSIWRQGIKQGGHLLTTADLLSNHDPDLLPYGMKNRSKKLSPVERMFGVVEERDIKTSTAEENDDLSANDQAFGFAGKVRIGFGLPGTDTPVKVEQNPVTLKELSSPKPPSPAFYLKNKNADFYLSKDKVASNPSDVTLRGRKHYLHALRENNDIVQLTECGRPHSNGRPPWESKFNNQQNNGNKRRIRVQPIQSDTDFHFEIDFNNLDATELAQLCVTLQPAPKFEHRLGMGKPLGLGSVKIEPVGLFLINRHQRYAADSTDCDRYHRVWLKDDHAAEQSWPEYLRQHDVTVSCTQTFNDMFGKLVQKGLAELAETGADIKRALQLLGDPQYIGIPVHYPIAKNGTLENKHFEWFGNNDKHSKKPLTSITADTTEIPPLKKNNRHEGG